MIIHERRGNCKGAPLLFFLSDVFDIAKSQAHIALGVCGRHHLARAVHVYQGAGRLLHKGEIFLFQRREVLLIGFLPGFILDGGHPVGLQKFAALSVQRPKIRDFISFIVLRHRDSALQSNAVPHSRGRKQSRKEDWKKSFRIIVTRMRSVTFSIVSARTASGFKQENCLITILYSLVLWAQANLRSQII